MSVFKNGSVWLKADFHLHTRADKEFKYDGNENDFVKIYVDQLKSEEIGVGVITNHNKFDKDEFNTLRKQAAKNNIYLLPGIEFSLKEGIHILIVFDDKWYKGHENNIQDFLNSAFFGIANADIPPYPNSNFDLNETVDKLNQIDHDYFIVMAHVDADSGLFNVLSGRTLDAFAQNESFNRVLAVQKSGNRDKYSRLCSLANRQLACVEGSDNAEKGIDAIGKGRITYIKIGDFNFEAVKYALTDINDRIRPKEKPVTNNSYIKSISFEGGLLDGTGIDFSPELNNFIGIRGSGKSSILEILRYTLGIPLGVQAIDRNYKNGLIEHVLKSGGKIIVTAVNEHKEEYRIEKIYGQKEDIFNRGNRIDASINAVFKNPVYFGQKDLSNKDIDFEADLVHKLIGKRIKNIQAKIISKKADIEDVINRFKQLDNLGELKKETEGLIRDAEHNIEFFREKGVEEKLRQQSLFDSDISGLEEIGNNLEGFLSDMNQIVENHSAFFKQTVFKSEENKEIFQKAAKIFAQLKGEYDKLAVIKGDTNKLADNFNNIITGLKEKKEGLKEEFARIKRDIDIPNLNADEFLKLNRQIKTSKLKLKEIEKSENKRSVCLKELNNKISDLNNLWHEEYKILENEVKRINKADNPLSIEVEYKGRRDKFLEKLKYVFKGSGIRDAAYQSMQDKYKDFIEIYRNPDNLNSILNENHSAEFNRRFSDNFADLLTFQIDNRFVIKYKNKPLASHSLGQRASALILFLLAQKETDVLIIDQPEDDLDNQTIYEEVIKELKSLKGDMQFIFATHNANIPVLGDSEKVVACVYSDDKIDIHAGTIDCRDTQKRIVEIMEGGREAFNRRKNIYGLWRMEK